MDFFLYLLAAAGFGILSLCFFVSALWGSYKYGSWRGLLLCLGRGALSPASLLLLMLCAWISVFFSEKFDLSKTVIAAVFIAWILGSLLPWGIVVKNGIKNQKTIQMWVGIFGLAAAVSFIASFLCFVKFCHLLLFR